MILCFVVVLLAAMKVPQQGVRQTTSGDTTIQIRLLQSHGELIRFTITSRTLSALASFCESNLDKPYKSWSIRLHLGSNPPTCGLPDSTQQPPEPSELRH